MPLPWTKGRFALIREALRGRHARFVTAMLAAVAMVLLNFLSPQIIRFTVDYVISEQTLVVVDGETFAVDEDGNLSEPYTPPAFLQSWLDEKGGRDFLLSHIWLCGAAVALTALFSGLMNYTRRYCTLEASEYMAKRLRDTLFAHIQTLPYEWHVKSQTGDIIQRSTSDVDTIRNFLSNQFVEMARIAFQLVTAAFLMLTMDVTMALFSFTLIPVIFFFSLFYFKAIGKQFKAADEAEGALQAAAQENYTGVRVVRAFGREQYEVERFREKNEHYTNLWIKTINYLAFYWSFGDLMAGLQMTIILAAGIFRCAAGDVSVGTFIAFTSYAGMMIWPVRALGRMLSELSKAAVSAGRVKEVLETAPERDESDALRPDITGCVVFDHVHFRYADGTEVLRDISFTLKPGETMAILGGTGSGKSTLIHLLCRLYDVEEGQGLVTVDGTDIRKIAREHIRRNVGLVLQEPFLYSKSLKLNIAAPRPAAGMEAIRDAAQTAQVHDAIEGFSEGYETVVGERGVTLSGGQKQRVAIARTILTDAPILIFDDSLSAVDTETDARIRAALRARKRDGSTIIISHRISTLMQADKILVLRDGAVEEMGSHEELLQNGGSYKRIYDMQATLENELSGETKT